MIGHDAQPRAMRRAQRSAADEVGQPIAPQGFMLPTMANVAVTRFRHVSSETG
ncbi:MAG: hypothetical protein ABI650_11740 [Dokdonella sp.]